MFAAAGAFLFCSLRSLQQESPRIPFGERTVFTERKVHPPWQSGPHSDSVLKADDLQPQKGLLQKPTLSPTPASALHKRRTVEVRSTDPKQWPDSAMYLRRLLVRGVFAAEDVKLAARFVNERPGSDCEAISLAILARATARPDYLKRLLELVNGPHQHLIRNAVETLDRDHGRVLISLALAKLNNSAEFAESAGKILEIMIVDRDKGSNLIAKRIEKADSTQLKNWLGILQGFAVLPDLLGHQLAASFEVTTTETRRSIISTALSPNTRTDWETLLKEVSSRSRSMAEHFQLRDVADLYSMLSAAHKSGHRAPSGLVAIYRRFREAPLSEQSNSLLSEMRFLELTRFRGHLPTEVERCHDVKENTPHVSGGVPSEDRRFTSFRSDRSESRQGV